MSLEDEAKHILLKMGLWWPDADSGKLRDAAGAWRTFAEAVDDVRSPVNNSAMSIIHHNQGEAIEAFEKFWGRYAKGKDAGWISDLSDAARKMAHALDTLADAIDDAINKLWTQIGIDAAVIAGGIALAFFTAGLASGAAAVAAEAIIELGSTLGIAVSTTVAELAAGTLMAAAFGSLESVTVDIAVAQPLKIAAGMQTGLSLDEINQAAKDGMIYGAAFGVGFGVLKPGVNPALADSPFLAHPPSLRPNLVELGPAARQAERTPCVGEPIDVATGAMLMTQTDLTLPAADLPLVFQRTHLSSYRAGLCFGPTWTSTLDECVQIDGEGVVFAAADGMRLVYPVPQPGRPVLPVKGARWPLEWDGKPDGIMTITDPTTGVIRTFTTPIPSGTPGVFRLPLDSWHDRNNTHITVERNHQGIPTALRHSGGYYVAVDTRGHRVTALRLLDEAPSVYDKHNPATSAGTVVMRYGYDDEGRLTEVINSSGKPLRFTYDTEGRVTRWTDRNGTWFGYVHDECGRVVRTDGVDGILSGTLAYDEAARTTTYTDSQGHVSVHRYNAEGQVTEEKDPLGHITRTEWDEYGTRPLAVTDPLGHTTRYTYDDAGNQTDVALPDGALAQAEYNTLGLPTEVVEPGGAVWRHTYDERGNRLTTVDALGAETRYEYDDAGRPTAITNALGHTRTMILNSAGLPISITDELGHTTTLRRDIFGRIIEVIDPLGHMTRTYWTIEGKPARRELPDGTREVWTWDDEGNLLTYTDPAGNITQHTPGLFDVPATRTDPDGAHYEFAYDTELRLTTVTNPQGRQWSYTYDAAGRLTAETDFNGRSVAYAHDAAGRLTARTNGANEALLYIRDAMGRVIEQRTGTDDITTYAYGPSGNLIRAANADAEVVLEYDALGRLLSDSVNGRTMVYAYDALGQRTRRVTPTGLATDWTYDPAGRLAELRSEEGFLAFTHDAAGRETQSRIGDGVILTQTWDATDRLTTQTLASSPSSPRPTEGLLQHRSYAYQPDGHVSEIRELTSGTRRFAHDAVGRTTAVRALGWSETYAYDATGNLTHATAPGHPEPDERSFTGSLLRAAGRTAYAYDPQGRLVRKTRKLLNGQTRTWTYTWNAEDRLTAVVTPNGECWHYTYDPLGRRISKRRTATNGHATATTDFSWDDNRLAEQSVAEGRATTWTYAPGTHRPLTQTDHWPRTRTPGTSFLAQLAEETTADHSTRFHATVTDLVGTPTELVTADGELVWQHRTTLWGTELPAATGDQTAVECPLRFPGQYADAETGLNYNHSRYYDPETARYISPDPLGLEPAPNDHAYVASPLSISDPLGLNPCGIASVKGPAGETLPLPKGATGTPVATGKGWAYDVPSGTKGLDPRVTQVRVMDPVTTGKYQYPNGYVVYMNKAGQSVNPLTGQTVSKADPCNHIPIP